MDSRLEKHRRLHFDLSNVGLRAHATAVGLVQLCIELRNANILTEGALERIKCAIADDVSLSAPRGISARKHRDEMKSRLDVLFTGTEEIGPVSSLAIGTEPDH
jgi:hypothetical protein